MDRDDAVPRQAPRSPRRTRRRGSVSDWDAWNLDRAVLLFTALAYLVIWIQLSLFHWAGGFKHWAMWGPVIATPLVVAGAVVGALERDSPWGWVAFGLLAFG